MTRPPAGCVHMAQYPDQVSMYYEGREYCLPCIVTIAHRTHDRSLDAGVAMETYSNAGRVLPRRTA